MLDVSKLTQIADDVLTRSHTMTPFENNVGKGEIAHNEQFLLFPQCFLPVWITFFDFRQI